MFKRTYSHTIICIHIFFFSLILGKFHFKTFREAFKFTKASCNTMYKVFHFSPFTIATSLLSLNYTFIYTFFIIKMSMSSLSLKNVLLFFIFIIPFISIIILKLNTIHYFFCKCNNFITEMHLHCR